jgi:hypothetical protein
MRKLLILLPVVALVAACSSSPKETYDRRAYEAEQKREQYAERAVDKAPKWMTELPKSNAAVYANGTAVSGDFSMADEKAKTIAFGKICMAAGGKVDQQSKIFMQDTAVASTEVSELAIRSMCPSVDITGTEIREVKRIAEGGRFRTYVLLALPTGEANALQKRKDQLKLNEGAVQRGTEAFKELDRNAEPAPVKATPTVQLYPYTTLSPGERVVIKETLN